jgi:Amt family ammonium transporter
LTKESIALFMMFCLADLGFAGSSLAKDAGVIDTGNTAWMLTATAIVLLMTIPGVALFYAGMVRKINVLATFMQTFAITCLVSIIWMIVGYSLAFSNGGSRVVGNLDFAFLRHLSVKAVNGTIPETVFIVFQLTFAIITAALITGAVAERMRFSALMWFVGLWSIIVYSPVTFWVWGGGFLSQAGILDFAGGTVVHINSGVAALVAAVMVGKRAGYGEEDLAPHNLVLTMIGGSLLWVGWFGFNAGSAVGSNGSAGMAMLVTHAAAAAAALTWMLAEWVHH